MSDIFFVTLSDEKGIFTVNYLGEFSCVNRFRAMRRNNDIFAGA